MTISQNKGQSEETFVACDGEIDLREVAQQLWSQRWWIVGITLGLAFIVWLVNAWMLPKWYEAEVALMLKQPTFQVKLEADAEFLVAKLDIQTASALVHSSEVFQILASDDEIKAAWKGEDSPLTWATLAERASVTTAGKQNLKLIFRDTNPQRAALIANRWAEEAVKRINAEYSMEEALNQINVMTQQTHQVYQAAEAAYARALTQNHQNILTKRLEQAENDLTCVLARQSNVQQLEGELKTFDAHLQTLSANERLMPGDAIVLVALQQRVWTIQDCAGEMEGLQTQWSVEDLTAFTIADVALVIKELQTVLKQQGNALYAQQMVLEERILQLQQELEEEKARLQEFAHQRDVTWQAYDSLVKLYTQVKALVKEDNDVVVVVSKATPPNLPSSPRVLINTTLAGVLGFILSGLAVLVWSWWRQEENSSESERL